MAHRTKRSRRSEAAPGWAWMLFGLTLGLVVALVVYLRGGSGPPPVRTAAAPAQASAAQAAAQTRAPARADAAESRFDFYDILPQFDVVVPEVEPAAGRDVRSKAVEEPGRYILQAGSFTSVADADRLQASLALLGVESRIQRVTIDDDVYHRVRIGPISDLTDLNRIRRQLREARIEPLLMKVP